MAKRSCLIATAALLLAGGTAWARDTLLPDKPSPPPTATPSPSATSTETTKPAPTRSPDTTSLAPQAPTQSAAPTPDAAKLTSPSLEPLTPAEIVGKARLGDDGLIVNGKAVKLLGIEWLPPGDTRQGREFDNWLQGLGPVFCDPAPKGTYVCLTSKKTGVDLAQAALINGDAKATNSPDTYKKMEAQAHRAKKGIWQ